jgi:hypothetical protein
MIKTGGGIKAKFVFSHIFSVDCKFMQTTLLPFSRDFYAQMPPLQKFAEEIMDSKNCWDSLRELARPSAEEICRWDGWHPLIKAQLMMYFQLCEKVEFKNGKPKFDE